MTIVFHARLYGRFIEIKSNPRRKKLHRRNQSSFLEGSFTNGDNAKATIQFWRERQPQHLEGCSFQRIDPSVFTSIAPVLSDWANETIWRELNWIIEWTNGRTIELNVVRLRYLLVKDINNTLHSRYIFTRFTTH